MTAVGSTPTQDGPEAAVTTMDLFAPDRVRLDEVANLRELRDDLVRAAYQRRTVQLSSGVSQPYYFDKYVMTSRPSILRRIGRLLAARVPHDTDRLAAPTLGAVAVGTAVSLETGLPLLIVRTTVDPDRQVRAVEGGLHEGESVCLVEDVVVTGSRAMTAVQRLRDAGAQVSSLLCVLDCEHGADVRIAAAGIRYEPLFSYSALSLPAAHS